MPAGRCESILTLADVGKVGFYGIEGEKGGSCHYGLLLYF